MEIILPDDHFSITSTSDVAEICAPLFTHSPVDYYWYAKLYPNGNYSSLSTNGPWNQHIFSQNQYLKPAQVILGQHLVSLFAPDKSADASNQFNLNHLFITVSEQQSYYEFTGFASHDKSSKVLDYYFNNRENLKRFTIYFKNRGLALIDKTDAHPVKLPNFKNSPLDCSSSGDESLKDLLKINKYKVNWRNSTVNITARELDCLQLLSNGKTAKYIGKKLDISFRTVESYLENIRNKLNLSTKNELLVFLEESELASG